MQVTLTQIVELVGIKQLTSVGLNAMRVAIAQHGDDAALVIPAALAWLEDADKNVLPAGAETVFGETRTARDELDERSDINDASVAVLHIARILGVDVPRTHGIELS